MKHLSSLVVVLLFLINSVKSQTITITFEATRNGAPIPLDSILVMNLTAGGDTTIYFPDHVLVLSTVGIGEADIERLPIRALPNPFAGVTDVVVDAQGGELLFMLHDATGRELASHRSNVAAGQQRFRVTCERPGVHLLTVVQGGVRRSVRLLAIAGGGASSVVALGRSGINSIKSDRSLFTWTPGDALRYIGYATDAGIVRISAIDDVPVASTTRVFLMDVGVACPNTPSVTDMDGNTYPVVQIGSQCWMAENLRTAMYHDGTPIPNVTDDIAWAQLNTGAWCNYGNSPGYDATYGKLYNWYAAVDPNICPQGWHMPTDNEWQQLEAVLGMPMGELAQIGYRGEAQNVGGKMKSTAIWNAPNQGATNESGFSSLPAGVRLHQDGDFYSLGYSGSFWSASESDWDTAWFRGLDYSTAVMYRWDFGYKTHGFSVRCIKD